MTADTLSDRLSTEIARAENILARGLEICLRPYELEALDFAGLQVIALLGGQPNQSQVASATCISEAHLSRIARRLEARGLVNRSVNLADRRELLLSLTREGYLLLQKTSPIVEGMVRASALTQSEEAELSRLLLKLKASH